jgi:hypothetical protein
VAAENGERKSTVVPVSDDDTSCTVVAWYSPRQEGRMPEWQAAAFSTVTRVRRSLSWCPA